MRGEREGLSPRRLLFREKQYLPVIFDTKTQNLYADAIRTGTAKGPDGSSGTAAPASNEGKGVRTMANSSNNLVNPNAREAMDRFKMEAASEVGVNLKQGYNGDLTSKQAGSVGGQMVKKMIEAYENGMK